MAENTYKARVLVLRKTKLGETDLIVTLLDEEGQLRRAVAKGARKPTSPFAARLELYRCAKVLCAHGKSLDIVKEARADEGGAAGALTLEQSVAAAPFAELLCMLAQEGLDAPRLFEMSSVTFSRIGAAGPETALSLSAAALLKALALAGFRPSLNACVACGEPVDLAAYGQVPFSFVEGGVVCGRCERPADALLLDADMLTWAHYLLYATFEQVEGCGVDPSTTFGIFHLLRQWIRVHAGANMKSLTFLLSCGLF